MFFLVPLIIVLFSLSGIFFIAWRKFPYLKKISTPVSATVENYGFLEFVHDFFPEIFYQFRKIDLNSYKTSFLKEFEKFLRRMRVLSLKIDRLTNSLLAKIRVENLKNGQSVSGEFKEEPKTSPISQESKFVQLKKEEQSLIIEIAKNPKNPDLYKKLAEVYIVLKNSSDARESLKAALELNPEDQQTKEKLEAVKKLLPM